MTPANALNHPVRTLVNSILALEDNPAFSDSAISEPAEYAFARDKVFAIARLIQTLLDTTPAIFVSAAALANLAPALQHPFNELTAFVSDKNPGHLTSATAQIDQVVMPLMWGFAPHSATVDATLVPALLTQLQETASKSIQQLALQRDAVEQKLKESEERAIEIQTRLNQIVESTTKDRAEASAAVARLEQAFSEKETARGSAFTETLNTLATDFKVFEEDSKRTAKGMVDDLLSKQSQAAQIVQVVGNIGATGNYQKIANSESEQANTWRKITVGVFVLGIGMAISTFVEYWGVPLTATNIGAIGIRLLYAIAITAPALYTAQESARHRTNADRARQTELELASIGPFIELLPPEKKIEIRESLVKMYFGRPVEAHEPKTLLDSAKAMAEIIKVIKA